MKAITTRSGVAYEGPSIPTNPSPKKVVERETEETTDKEQNKFQGSTAQIPPPVIPISISTRISLTLNKEKLLELAKIPLNGNCSAMLLKKLLEKLGDPGKFLIPCNFPGMDLSLPELTPTRMTLELADRSITHPKGLVEDVYVKVGKFHFPTDFVVVDFEADPQVPLILGRSFLRTGRALIDVFRPLKRSIPTLSELVVPDWRPTIGTHVDASDFVMVPFCNDQFAKVMSKYGVTHRLATAYHPQTSRQVESVQSWLKNSIKDDHDTLITFSPKSDPLHHEFAGGVIGTDNQEKDEKQSQNDKTGLGMEKL
ncbi:reverse transcriptase domain-containing protein [Tanacetum coccineum]